MSLFAVYLGGRAEGCTIELHDVVFVVGDSIEQTYPRLIQKWFGNQKRLHVDSYICLTKADGFSVELSNTPDPSDLKLFFMNFGGYTENLFGEVHENAFFVAPTKPEALKKARDTLCIGMIEPHLDDALDVESELDALDIDDVIEICEVDGYYLNFTPIEAKERSLAVPGYRTMKHLIS